FLPLLLNFLKPFFCLSLLLVSSVESLAQDSQDYDELVVELSVPDLGTMEIPIAVRDQEAYISVADLFDLLKIKAERTEAGIEGFIIHPDSTYLLSPSQDRIMYKGSIFPSKTGFIETPTALYLRSDLFGNIFGLNTDFSFRSLSVDLETELELPVIKEIKREKMRENLDRVKGVVHADTILPRNYPFFRAGNLDW